MKVGENQILVRMRRSTHQAIKHEACELGLKQWAMIEKIAEHYFKSREG